MKTKLTQSNPLLEEARQLKRAAVAQSGGTLDSYLASLRPKSNPVSTSNRAETKSKGKRAA